MAETSYQVQITDLSNKRAAQEARMIAIQDKAIAEGRTKDDSEKEEFKTIQGEIIQMDEELKDLRDFEAMNRSKAQPIVAAPAAVIPGTPSRVATDSGAAECAAGHRLHAHHHGVGGRQGGFLPDDGDCQAVEQQHTGSRADGEDAAAHTRCT